MSVLLKEIKLFNTDAARTLEQADFRTDSDIQSLTREDLHELFPGAQKLRLRRNLFEIIHKQKPINLLLQEMKEFIPRESFRAAQSENGVLAEYLKILKDVKTQVNHVQAFLDAHIDLLENSSKNQADREPDRGYLSGTSTSGTCGPVEPTKFQNSGNPDPQGRQSISSPSLFSYQSTVAQVTCGIVVTGTTFNAHQEILDKVKSINNQNLDLVRVNLEESPSNQDYSIIIVFCPIISRVGTDIEAAMRKVTGDKPVILVLMHHTREAKNTTSVRSYGDDFSNLVLHVSVFYHDTMHGLLTCQENDKAVSEIQRKLLEYSIIKSKDSGNTQRMSAGRDSVPKFNPWPNLTSRFW